MSSTTEKQPAMLNAEDFHTLENVRAILSALTKLVHGRKIYAKNNPTLIRFQEDFKASLSRYFELEGELVLAIDKYRIHWGEESVYENDKRDDSLAFLLYKDGIGEISIQRTVAASEIEALIDILTSELHSAQGEDDVVTKLWRADLENISYRVLDEYLTGEYGEGKQADGDAPPAPLEVADHPDLPSFADKGRVIVDTTAEMPTLGSYLQAIANGSGPSSSDVVSEKHFQDMMNAFFTISSEELKLCQEEIHEEGKGDTLVQFLAETIDFLLIGDNPSMARDASTIIESMADYIVAERVPSVMGDFLDVLRRFADRHPDATAVGSFVDSLCDKFTGESLLMSLADEVRSQPGREMEVFGYFTRVGPEAIPVICRMLERIRNPKTHRHACDVLLELASGEVTGIVEKLNMDKPGIAQDAIYLVQQAGDGSLPPMVRELLHYPSAHVREETIGYLAELGSPEAIDMLLPLLDDHEKNIRIKTLNALGAHSTPATRERITGLAFDKDLTRRSFDEQEVVFKTFGRIVGEDAIIELRQFIEKRSLFSFGRRHGRDQKLLAIKALAQIEGEESILLLAELSGDSDETVRSNAKRTLNRVQRNANEGNK